MSLGCSLATGSSGWGHLSTHGLSISRGDPACPWLLLCCVSFPSVTWPSSNVFSLSVRSVMIPVSYKGHSVNETWHHCSEAVFKLKYYRKGSTLQTFDVTAPVSEGSCEYRSHCRRHRVSCHFQEGEEGADRVNKSNSNCVSRAGAVGLQSWSSSRRIIQLISNGLNTFTCGGHIAVIFFF